MFGYITPDINELKVKEYALFQSYYCGLCRVLKREYKTTACLNYDAVFVYILKDGLNNADFYEPKNIKCGLHRVRGKPAIITDSADYVAAVNIMMAYYKLKDDIADEGIIKHLIAPLRFKKKYNTAAVKYPEIALAAEEMWQKQRRIESSRTTSTDEAAQPYAELFGTVLKNISRLYECQLYDLGYALGRWVYLIDAYDDIKKDLKNGSYNVYIQKYNIKNPEEISEDLKLKIQNSFYYTLARAYDAYCSLDLIKNQPILSNIIQFGLKKTTKAVTENHNEREKDGSLPRFGR